MSTIPSSNLKSSKISTRLADFHVRVICINCKMELPSSALVQRVQTVGALWIVASCGNCGYRTPKLIQAEGSAA